MKRRLITVALLLPPLVLAAGCSSTSTTPSPSPSSAIPSPSQLAGGEAEAFCQQVNQFVADMRSLASGSPESMDQVQQDAQELANKAAKFQTDLARDPAELQKVQDCLSELDMFSTN